MSSPSKIEIGHEAESVAERVLVAHGYVIVERNFRCDVGELDVIARDPIDRSVLVFVEVRSRADDTYGHAAEMVTPAKRARVTRVATAYLELMRPIYERCRFDVVAITGTEVEIVQDAWRLGIR